MLSERVLTDLRELGTRLGLDPDSAELSQIAHKGVSVLEPPVLQSVLLFDKPGCQTLVGWLPKGVPFPSLLGARNKVESLRIVVWGYVGLWDKRWFRGPAFHAFSTIGTAFNLGPYGNQAESGMHW